MEKLSPHKAPPSVADQTISAATTALVVGSGVAIPTSKLRVGSVIRWRLAMSKTAAGIAARSLIVQMGVGSAGAPALTDADVITFVMPAGTAIADKATFFVDLVIRTIGAAGVICGNLTMMHNLSATGFAAIPTVVMQQNSAGVDMTVANLFLSLVITTGAAEVLTIQQVVPEALNLL